MAEGYWSRITDRKSAMSAVQMAGLPVVLIAAMNFQDAPWGLITISGIAEILTEPWLSMLGWSFGGALFFLGLSLKTGWTALMPLAAIIMMANTTVTVWVYPWWTLAIQAIVVLLALSGLRGWWWLRQNPA